jgi:hypothetical protein
MIALLLTILSAWLLIGLAVALLVGPMLRDRSAAYPPIGGAL